MNKKAAKVYSVKYLLYNDRKDNYFVKTAEPDPYISPVILSAT